MQTKTDCWQNCRDGIYSSDGFTCIVESRHISGKSIEESWANARLIAAAPDLLAACQRLLNAADEFNSLYDDDSRAEAYAGELKELSKAKDKVRAAIAKAQSNGTWQRMINATK